MDRVGNTTRNTVITLTASQLCTIIDALRPHYSIGQKRIEHVNTAFENLSWYFNQAINNQSISVDVLNNLTKEENAQTKIPIRFDQVAEDLAGALAVTRRTSELGILLDSMSEAQKKTIADSLLWRTVAHNKSRDETPMVQYICEKLKNQLSTRGKTWAFVEGAVYGVTRETLNILFNQGAAPSQHDGPIQGRIFDGDDEFLQFLGDLIEKDAARQPRLEKH